MEKSVAEQKIPLMTRNFPPQGMKHALQYQQRKFPLVVLENYVAKIFPISFFNSVNTHVLFYYATPMYVGISTLT